MTGGPLFLCGARILWIVGRLGVEENAKLGIV